jgi:hypothetical protein
MHVANWLSEGQCTACCIEQHLCIVKASRHADTSPFSGSLHVLTGLYKGLLPNILKLAPAAGISWYVFEESKSIMGINPRS